MSIKGFKTLSKGKFFWKLYTDTKFSSLNDFTDLIVGVWSTDEAPFVTKR